MGAGLGEGSKVSASQGFGVWKVSFVSRSEAETPRKPLLEEPRHF